MNTKVLKKGKRIWRIDWQDNQFRLVRGLENGKLIIGDWQEGDEKKVNSLINNKIKNKYNENGEQDYFVAMSAKNIRKTSPKFPCIVEPKCDGVRIEVTSDGLYTTHNQSKTLSKKIEHLVTLEKELMKLRNIVSKYLNTDDFILEGELYNHYLGFENSLKAISSNKDHLTVQFWWFDISIKGFTQAERIAIKSKCFEQVKTDMIVNMPYYLVNNKEELKTLFNKFISDGYEGIMVKNPLAYYQNKRTSDILKWKNREDIEVTIIDILEGKGERKGCAGKYIIQFDYKGNSITQEIDLFNVNKEFHKDALINKEKYIGATITVEYMKQEKSGKLTLAKGDANSLVFKAVRDYE